MRLEFIPLIRDESLERVYTGTACRTYAEAQADASNKKMNERKYAGMQDSVLQQQRERKTHA